MSGIIRITKEFSFETAHALEGYDGACRHIHGHSYRMKVTVSGSPIADDSSPKCGMVMDFGDLKRIVVANIVSRFDHAMVIRRTPDNGAFVDSLRARYESIIETPYQPTSENLLLDFVQVLKKHLPPTVKLESVELYETATSCAQWRAEDNER